MKRRKRSIIKYFIIPFALIVAMLASFLPGNNLGKVYAKATFDGTTQVISEHNRDDGDRAFTILEIVPDYSYAQFGYLIDGQEPIKWKNELAQETSTSARQNRIQGLLTSWNNLVDTNGTNAPMSYSEYSESYYNPDETGSYGKLMLSSSNEKLEEENTEYFMEAVDGSGDYNLVDGTYIPLDTPVAGGYNQNVVAYVYDAEGSANNAYYRVAFVGYDDVSDEAKDAYKLETIKVVYSREELEADTISNATLVYRKSRTGSMADYYEYAGTKVQLLNQEGALDFTEYYYFIDAGFTLANEIVEGEQYYKVQNVFYGYNSIREKGTGDYYPILNPEKPYIKQESPNVGNFRLEGTTHYEYATGENGNYRLRKAAAGQQLDHEVVPGVAYYQGGFSNNNWFFSKVMDINDADTQFYCEVKVVTPADIQISELELYDMVVIEGSTCVEGVSVKKFTADNDIGISALNNILANTATQKSGFSKPIIVDSVLNPSAGSYWSGTDVGSNMHKLVAMLRQKDVSGTYNSMSSASWDDIMVDSRYNPSQHYVNNNIYVIGVNSTPLIDSGFDNPFITGTSDEALVNNAGLDFADVANAISDENLYRRSDQGSTAELFEDKISRARVIEYIINYSKTVRNAYDYNLRVLELQPAMSTSFSEGLTASKIEKNWFKNTDYDTEAANDHVFRNVVVDTMQTPTFIGKIDDINATYDLVYVGMNTSNMNTKTSGGQTITDYNDNNMDGLVYTNIGDVIVTYQSVLGMLDSDYGWYRKYGTVYTYTRQKTVSVDESSMPNGYRNWGWDGTNPQYHEDRGVTYFRTTTYSYQVWNGNGWEACGKPNNIRDDDWSWNQGGYYTASSGNGGNRKYYRRYVNYSYSKAIDDTESTDNPNIWGNNWSWSQDRTYEYAKKDGITYYRKGEEKLIEEKKALNSCVSLSDVINSTGVGKEGTGVFRYSGNDITKEKYDDLKEFVDAGYPVVLAEGFLAEQSGGYSVNSERIDNSSYMYQFGAYCIKEDGTLKDNIMIEGKISDRLLLQRLKMSNPSLETGLTSGTVQLDNHLISFEFMITNTGAADVTATFDVGFFLDVNADGKFSRLAERISADDLVISRVSDGGIEYPDDDGKFRLSANNTNRYKLEYTLPSDYVGTIPWKMEVSQNTNSNRRAAQTGYFHVTSQKETIKVLQIISNSGSTNLSLKKASIYGGDSNSAIYVLMQQVNDFQLDVTESKSGDVATTVKSNPSYLESFDMLVIGFADVYSEAPGEDGKILDEAIKKFINSGSSVLFTHDTTSFTNTENDAVRIDATTGEGIANEATRWNYYFNTIVRPIVGMDRYGILSDALKDSSGDNVLKGLTGVLNKNNEDDKDKYNLITGESSLEVAYVPKSNREQILVHNQGYTYATLNQWGGKNSKDNTSGAVIYPKGYGGDDRGNCIVSKVNSGQITTYPFVLDDQFVTKDTHYQYYQLNFAADDDNDGESDLVVWYTINGVNGKTNDIYKSSAQDVRNNYYIYNKGNVTYSGVGHSDINMNKSDLNDTSKSGYVQELKLYINTIVAAYSATTHGPSVDFKEGSAYNSISKDSVYVPYDVIFNATSQEDEQIGESEEVYLYMTDSNLVRNMDRKAITASFYIEDPNGDKTITSNGAEVKVRSIDLTLTDVRTDYEIDDLTELESGVSYKIEIPYNLLSSGSNSVKIYVEAFTTIYKTDNTEVKTSKSVDRLNLVRRELFNLD